MTETQTRKAGLRGRLPKKPPAERFNIQYLSAYLTSPLPAPAYPVDVTAGVTDWEMLGNGPDPTCTTHPNGVGDCTFAGRQHYRMAKAAAVAETETWESSNALVTEYLAYDHGKDQGAQHRRPAPVLVQGRHHPGLRPGRPHQPGRGGRGHGRVPRRLRRREPDR